MGVLDFLEGGGSPDIVDANGQILVKVPVYVDDAVPATTSNGLLNVGPGPWDGTSAGHFAGNASGTGIAANFPSGYTGDVTRAQIAGADVYRVDYNGYLTANRALVNVYTGPNGTSQPIMVPGPAWSFNATDATNVQAFIWKSATGVIGLATDGAARLNAPGIAVPTIAAGADGTAATLDTAPACSDQRGGITVSSTTTAGALCTVTFNAAWGSAPFINLTPRNAASVGTLYYTSTTTGFTVYSTLTTVQALSFSYVCMG